MDSFNAPPLDFSIDELLGFAQKNETVKQKTRGSIHSNQDACQHSDAHQMMNKGSIEKDLREGLEDDDDEEEEDEEEEAKECLEQSWTLDSLEDRSHEPKMNDQDLDGSFQDAPSRKRRHDQTKDALEKEEEALASPPPPPPPLFDEHERKRKTRKTKSKKRENTPKVSPAMEALHGNNDNDCIMIEPLMKKGDQESVMRIAETDWQRMWKRASCLATVLRRQRHASIWKGLDAKSASKKGGPWSLENKSKTRPSSPSQSREPGFETAQALAQELLLHLSNQDSEQRPVACLLSKDQEKTIIESAARKAEESATAGELCFSNCPPIEAFSDMRQPPDFGKPCSKSHCQDFLREPIGERFGERECVSGQHECVCATGLPVWPCSNNAVTPFVCREFLRPDQLREWQTKQTLPLERGLCLACLRYWTTFEFFLWKRRGEPPPHPIQNHAYALGGVNGYDKEDLLPCFDSATGSATGIVKPFVAWRADRYRHSSRHIHYTDPETGTACSVLVRCLDERSPFFESPPESSSASRPAIPSDGMLFRGAVLFQSGQDRPPPSHPPSFQQTPIPCIRMIREPGSLRSSPRILLSLTQTDAPLDGLWASHHRDWFDALAGSFNKTLALFSRPDSIDPSMLDSALSWPPCQTPSDPSHEESAFAQIQKHVRSALLAFPDMPQDHHQHQRTTQPLVSWQWLSQNKWMTACVMRVLFYKKLHVQCKRTVASFLMPLKTFGNLRCIIHCCNLAIVSMTRLVMLIWRRRFPNDQDLWQSGFLPLAHPRRSLVPRSQRLAFELFGKAVWDANPWTKPGSPIDWQEGAARALLCKTRTAGTMRLLASVMRLLQQWPCETAAWIRCAIYLSTAGVHPHCVTLTLPFERLERLESVFLGSRFSLERLGQWCLAHPALLHHVLCEWRRSHLDAVLPFREVDEAEPPHPCLVGPLGKSIHERALFSLRALKQNESLSCQRMEALRTVGLDASSAEFEQVVSNALPPTRHAFMREPFERYASRVMVEWMTAKSRRARLTAGMKASRGADAHASSSLAATVLNDSDGDKTLSRWQALSFCPMDFSLSSEDAAISSSSSDRRARHKTTRQAFQQDLSKKQKRKQAKRVLKIIAQAARAKQGPRSLVPSCLSSQAAETLIAMRFIHEHADGRLAISSDIDVASLAESLYRCNPQSADFAVAFTLLRKSHRYDAAVRTMALSQDVALAQIAARRTGLDPWKPTPLSIGLAWFCPCCGRWGHSNEAPGAPASSRNAHDQTNPSSHESAPNEFPLFFRKNNGTDNPSRDALPSLPIGKPRKRRKDHHRLNALVYNPHRMPRVTCCYKNCAQTLSAIDLIGRMVSVEHPDVRKNRRENAWRTICMACGHLVRLSFRSQGLAEKKGRSSKTNIPDTKKTTTPHALIHPNAISDNQEERSGQLTPIGPLCDIHLPAASFSSLPSSAQVCCHALSIAKAFPQHCDASFKALPCSVPSNQDQPSLHARFAVAVDWEPSHRFTIITLCPAHAHLAKTSLEPFLKQNTPSCFWPLCLGRHSLLLSDLIQLLTEPSSHARDSSACTSNASNSLDRKPPPPPQSLVHEKRNRKRKKKEPPPKKKKSFQ